MDGVGKPKAYAADHVVEPLDIARTPLVPLTATVPQILRRDGIYILPVFKNGKVCRITLPRYVARRLNLSPGDYATIVQNERGELVLGKFNVERIRDEYIQGGSGQLDLGAASAAAPRDRAREP
jgi:bifunctional DNA-binding transcriptional regulator/antitoxin component of YhaV-PrlF toxin-antitoxin module